VSYPVKEMVQVNQRTLSDNIRLAVRCRIRQGLRQDDEPGDAGCFRRVNGKETMKRTMLILLGLLCAGFWIAHVRAEETTRAAMRAKLDYARGVLEGLTMARFELVTTNAVLLRAHDYTNAFFFLGNPDYTARYTNFVRSVDRLLDAAKAENLERATLAYGEMTRSCVECHKTFRREQYLKSVDGALKSTK